MFVKWIDDKHSVKIEAIDNQHKELFLITNRIYELLKTGYTDSQLHLMLKRLYHYTKFHFTTEEGLFLKYGYGGTKNHIALHMAFTEKIKAALISHRQGEKIMVEELLDFLVNWIISHIQGEDREYAAFFAQNNINAELHFSLDGTNNTFHDDVLFVWKKKELQLNLKSIDDQHKELVYILQQANDLNKTGISEQRQRLFLPVILKKLFHYSGFHFIFEEELMAKYDYPLIVEHKKQHKIFMDKIVFFTKEYKEYKESLISEMVLFLKQWTLEHIIVEDRKYISYFKDE